MELFRRFRYWVRADRIGPDIPGNYWMLFFPKKMRKLCKKKFQAFADSADFRPGAYAVGCSKIRIGERVVIRPGIMLFGDSESLETSITIEDHVMMGCGVHIYINNHKFEDPNTPLIDQGYYADKAVTLKRGCWIGANAIILPGVTIGENAVIGAGSIVTKSVPDRVVAVGNPARVIKKIGA